MYVYLFKWFITAENKVQIKRAKCVANTFRSSGTLVEIIDTYKLSFLRCYFLLIFRDQLQVAQCAIIMFFHISSWHLRISRLTEVLLMYFPLANATNVRLSLNHFCCQVRCESLPYFPSSAFPFDNQKYFTNPKGEIT